MAVRTEHQELHNRFEVTATCLDLKNDAAIEQAFADLDEAIGLIKAELDAENSYSLYMVRVETPNSESPSASDLGMPEDSVWVNFGRTFWRTVAKRPEFHQRIADYVTGLEAIITLKGGWIFEDHETALGEACVTNLAMANVNLVPLYTQLLPHWDKEHEVNQTEAIDAIIRHHGLTPETEDLLYIRMVKASSQLGEDQLVDLVPFLDEQTGGFAKSPLFSRIVKGLVPDPSQPNAKDLLPYMLDDELLEAADCILDAG